MIYSLSKKPKIVFRMGRWVVFSALPSGPLIDQCLLFVYRLNNKIELANILDKPEKSHQKPTLQRGVE